ncbi:hypothetical protein BDD12DRAFT_863096 [Trichophaea hybrida]|nr:hypothetical protein BDD12DRAFT_863096 [Trichophaea hybrida]
MSSATGGTLQDLPKSSIFTSRLPADPAFPTPTSSASARLSKLGPRMVREALFTYATNPTTGERYEVQLKGAGKTPYSRFADGKAALRSSIREFIVSEHLHAIGIPTTRALSLTLLPGDKAVRGRLEPCAIVARMAQSWIRIGTFDLPRSRGDSKRIRVLVDYVCDEVLRLPLEVGHKYEAMYREVVRRNARTVALWQVNGFMNGVLNTDNTSMLGLSLDFGPFAFIDTFDPEYTPNHDDDMLRYLFKNLPTVIWWNLVRLAENVAELFSVPDPDDEEYIKNGVKEEHAEGLVKLQNTFLTEYNQRMAERMGFKTLKESDMDNQFSPVLDLMQKHELNFHHFFRCLAETPIDTLLSCGPEIMLPADTNEEAKKDIHEYLQSYVDRLKADEVDDEQRIKVMKQKNPKFVPKGWVLDEIIERVEKKGERKVLEDVMKLVERPFDGEWEGVEDAERWYGEVPRRKRDMQCSCSS